MGPYSDAGIVSRGAIVGRRTPVRLCSFARKRCRRGTNGYVHHYRSVRVDRTSWASPWWHRDGGTHRDKPIAAKDKTATYPHSKGYWGVRDAGDIFSALYYPSVHARRRVHPGMGGWSIPVCAPWLSRNFQGVQPADHMAAGAENKHTGRPYVWNTWCYRSLPDSGHESVHPCANRALCRKLRQQKRGGYHCA